LLEQSATSANEEDLPTFEPNYHKVWSLVEAADCEAVLAGGFAGLTLLSIRCDAQEKTIDKLERTKIAKEMISKWTELIRLSRKRSVRSIEFKMDNIPTLARKKAKNTHAGVTPRKTRSSTEVVVTPSPKPLKISRQDATPNATPKDKPKKPSMRCRKCGNNNVKNPGLKFHCVPSYPAELFSQNPTRKSVINREGKICLRREILDRIGESRESMKKLYVCENNNFETVTKYRLVRFKDKMFAQPFKLTVPIPTGEGKLSSLAVSAATASKGVGRDRAMMHIL
jgi:hypothetical protein